MRNWTILGPSLLVFAGTVAYASSTPDEKLEKEIGGWVASPPERCIDMRKVTSTNVYGDAMLFKVRSAIKYRTDSSGCPAQRVGLTIVTNSDHGRLCSGDVVGLQDLENGTVEGSCAVGEFMPYRRP